MYIYNDISDKNLEKDCILCLGDFDGVHTGHCQLIIKAEELADKYNCKVGIYTFSVNTKILLGTKNLSLLTTEEEKNSIFCELGVDFVCYDNFMKIKNLTPNEFCAYLTEHIGVRAVVCGDNFTFGKFASGKSTDLESLMQMRGVECEIVPGFSVNGTSVSSTEIRRRIICGDMDSAAEMLGYRYFIETEVVHGAKLGRKLGFPTVNQKIYGNKVIPAFGVYCCICSIDRNKYTGVVNVGIKPTVNENSNKDNIVFETHILDYSGDLYGKTVKLEFFKMLRHEKKFESLDELQINVLHNIEEAKAYFGKDGYHN